jgi:hypothetical protein
MQTVSKCVWSHKQRWLTKQPQRYLITRDDLCRANITGWKWVKWQLEQHQMPIWVPDFDSFDNEHNLSIFLYSLRLTTHELKGYKCLLYFFWNTVTSFSIQGYTRFYSLMYNLCAYTILYSKLAHARKYSIVYTPMYYNFFVYWWTRHYTKVYDSISTCVQ